MKKLYFDTEYNDCKCAEQRDYARVPAEKPFECRSSRKKRHRSAQRKHKRQDNFCFQGIPPGYQLCPIPEPEYKPKLRLSFERVNVEPQNIVPAVNNRGNYYPFSNVEEKPYPSDQRRILSGQYPCLCIPQTLPGNQYENTKDYQRCNCGYMFKYEDKQKRSPSCRKRAWNAVKSKTRCIFKSKPKRVSERQRMHERKPFCDNCANAYIYPVPVQLAPCDTSWDQRRVPCNRSQAVGTNRNYKAQSSFSTLSDDTNQSGDTPSEKACYCGRNPPRKMVGNYLPEEQSQNSPTGCPYRSGTDCCCVCDIDVCDCMCCCRGQCEEFTPDLHQNTQTSLQNIKERFTQTDFPKRCCRCCKCCARKWKYPTSLRSVAQNSMNNSGKCSGCDKCLFREGPCPKATKFVCPGGKRHEYPVKDSEENTPVKQPTKTQMVKTNSVQCIPPSQNKATSCDENFTCARINDLLADLWDGKCDENFDIKLKKNFGNQPFYSTPAVWTTNILKTVPCPKPTFINDGLFSSPLSGKKYDLCLHEIKSTTKLIGSHLPKPFDLDDEIFSKRMSKRFQYTTGEHSRLISAICDAILSKQDDNVCIGNSQLLCKNDLCSDHNLCVSKEEEFKESTRKIEKSKPVSKLTPKTKSLTSKSMLKHSSVIDNIANIPVTRTGLIPVRTSKISAKKSIKKKVETISETTSEDVKDEPSSSKAAVHSEASKFEGLDHYVSETSDVYENLQSVHFSEDDKKCRTVNENQKGNPPIDYDSLKHLDFSSIRFSKPPVQNETASQFFQHRFLDEKNFILKNLPSYSSSISNEQEIKSLLNSKLTPPCDDLLLNTSQLFQQSSSRSETFLDRNNVCESMNAEKKIDLMLAEIERRGNEKYERDKEFFGKKSC